jgi:hypothetical protein
VDEQKFCAQDEVVKVPAAQSAGEMALFKMIDPETEETPQVQETVKKRGRKPKEVFSPTTASAGAG